MRIRKEEIEDKLSVVSFQFSVEEKTGAAALQSFRELNVWRKGHELTLAVYLATKDFPSSERYGLTSQIRRAAASIGANIAEGCGRDGGPDFARFLQVAMGSASELEYHLLLAHDLNLLSDESHDKLTADTIEVKRMLASLIQKVRIASRNSSAKH